MTKNEALVYISNKFSDQDDDDAWWHQADGDTYRSLFLQLTDDHNMPVVAALGILESAAAAMMNEYGE
jgi:hypothetical protein